MDVFLSICLYMFCFFLSAWFSKKLLRNRDVLAIGDITITVHKNMKWKLTLSVLIVILPLVLVAALRGEEVGVDTATYISRFEEARTKKLLEIFAENKEDYLYNVVLFVSNQISEFPVFFLGFLQILALVPVVLYSIRHSYDVKPWAILLIYCLWHYNDSLNAVRQIIAFNWLLLAYDYLADKKRLKAALLFFVALGFHSSALLLGAAVFIVHFAAKKDIANIKKAIIVSAVVLVLLFGQNLFILLVNIRVLSHRYYLYINTFIYGNSLGRSEWISVGLGGVFEVLIRVFILISALLFVPPKARNKEYRLYSLMYLIGIVIYTAGLMIYHTSYFVRLSLCFDMFGLLLMSKIDQYSILSINRNGKRIHFLTVYISLLYWFIHILVLGQSGSIPYMFG